MSEKMLNSQELEQVVDAIIELYPREGTELKHHTEFELLVAAILSAQTTDTAVNRVTPELFEKYPTPRTMAEAPMADIRDMIQSIGLSNNKAKYLKQTSKILVEKYEGQVPRTYQELLELPGVGRKVAGVVLTNSFGIPAFAVDTHIERISQKLHFVPKGSSVLKIEKAITKKLPAEKWFPAHQSLIEFGRHQCTARVHDHAGCVDRIKEIMPKNKITESAYQKMQTEMEEL